MTELVSGMADLQSREQSEGSELVQDSSVNYISFWLVQDVFAYT
jgi:hypothetical protein